MGPLGAFAFIVLLLLVASSIGIVVWLAMLPGTIAVSRAHPQADAIRIAGWIGILTGVVWAVALVWAYTDPGAGASAGGDLQQRLADLEQRLSRLEGGTS